MEPHARRGHVNHCSSKKNKHICSLHEKSGRSPCSAAEGAYLKAEEQRKVARPKKQLIAQPNASSGSTYYHYSFVATLLVFPWSTVATHNYTIKMPVFRYYYLVNNSSTTVVATVTPDGGSTVSVSPPIAPGQFEFLVPKEQLKRPLNCFSTSTRHICSALLKLSLIYSRY